MTLLCSVFIIIHGAFTVICGAVAITCCAVAITCCAINVIRGVFYGVPYPPKLYKYDIINYFSYYYSEYFYYY